MNNKSIWNYDINYNKSNNIKNEVLDILIIGGGITGINIAYQFRNSNKKIALIDKSLIASGITKNTTAKLSYLQPDIIKIDKNKRDEYVKSQIDAVKLFKKIITDNNIECDFKETYSILFTQNNNNINKIKTIANILKNNKIDVKRVKNNKILYGIKCLDNYVFNPLKYIDSIIKLIEDKIDIYENVLAKNIKYNNNIYHVDTSSGVIKCKRVILACHYPFFIYPLFFPLKTYIKREYVNAFNIDKNKDYNVINIDKELISIRYYNNYLIYGSNSHKLTSKINYQKNYQKSYEATKKYFNKIPDYTWMNQDIVPNDYLPFIGRIKDNLYISTAYNAWGMTNSIIGSKIIYDVVNNKYNKYIKLFNPNRNNIKLYLNSFINSFSYIKVYFESLFKKNNPKYIKIKNIYYGIYKDSNNKIHKIRLICPHMKCNLVFNNQEKTWDCPCHGSRFDLDGNIINGPSKTNLKKDE